MSSGTSAQIQFYCVTWPCCSTAHVKDAEHGHTGGRRVPRPSGSRGEHNYIHMFGNEIPTYQLFHFSIPMWNGQGVSKERNLHITEWKLAEEFNENKAGISNDIFSAES